MAEGTRRRLAAAAARACPALPSAARKAGPRGYSSTWSRRCWLWAAGPARGGPHRAGLQPRRRGPVRRCEGAIEVDGPSHFCGRTPTVATALKRRQLRAAGSALLPVPYWEWDATSTGTRRPNKSFSGPLYSTCCLTRTPSPEAQPTRNSSSSKQTKKANKKSSCLYHT